MLQSEFENTRKGVPFSGPLPHTGTQEIPFQQDFRIALEVVSQLLRYPDAALHKALLRLCYTAPKDTKLFSDSAGPVGHSGQDYQWVQGEAARILAGGLPPMGRSMGRNVAEAYPQVVEQAGNFARSVAHMELTELQCAYVQVFDMEPLSSLHLSWHVYGDSPRQGRALAAFNEIYHDAGFDPLPGELPDYLPLVLEFMAVGPQWAAHCLCQHFGCTIVKLADQLDKAQSPYAPLIHYVVEVLHILPCAASPVGRGDHEVQL